MEEQSLTKYEALSTEDQNRVDKILFDEYDVIAEVGDMFIRNGYVLYITGIFYKDKMKYNSETKKYETTGERYIEIHSGRKDEEGNMRHYGTYSGRELSSIQPWKGTEEELKQQALQIYIEQDEGDDEKEEEPVSTGLSTLDNKEFIKTKRDLILQSNSIANRVKYMMLIMEKKKYALEQIKNKMMKEVKKLTTIIWTIELYMGLKEDIIRVQEGEPASNEEPIHLLQERLYMDEEVGDPTNGGLDFRNIDDFIYWLLSYSDYYKYENYWLLLPYEKCVRIMRVRREGKHYSENPWVNASMNEANFETIILIRNGTNIYYISTDMRFGNKLFPGQEDLMKLYEALTNDDHRGWKKSEEEVGEKMDEVIQRYKRNLVIMQGLIDRTEVFGDLYGKVNFLDGSAIEKGTVKLIYDCDKSHLVRDGQFSFKEWLADVNTRIGDGSRVVFNLSSRDYYTCDRFYRMHQGSNLWRSRKDYDYPAYPDDSVLHQVRIDKEYEKGQMFISFLPSDEIYDEDTREYRPRKFKVAFALFPEDDQLLNYDEITHREVQWLKDMMHHRETRKDYMSNMVFLQKVIKIKEEEMELEHPFCQLVMSQTGCSLEQALDLLHWWKTKNKLKRPLLEDDAKALRMIIKEHKRIQDENKIK